jgi:hypothetical protein
MRSILTDAIYRKHKECNGIKRMVQFSTIALAKSAMPMERIPKSIALLENGIFYSISRDHKQPIKRSEFNKELYKIRRYSLIASAVYYVDKYEIVTVQ